MAPSKSRVQRRKEACTVSKRGGNEDGLDYIAAAADLLDSTHIDNRKRSSPRKLASARFKDTEDFATKSTFSGAQAVESPQRRSSPRLKEKLKEKQAVERHGEEDSMPPTSPKSPSPQDSGIASGEFLPPHSLNKRPKKKLETMLDPSNVKGEGLTKETNQHLPYAVVRLPDGRVGRQCRASDTCPQAVALIEKRKRMVEHLKFAHGLEVDIPKLPMGRPPMSKLVARPFPHPYAQNWKRQACQRSKDKDRKFQINRQKHEHSQYMCAERAWANLRSEFKIKSKEDYIAGWVKERMVKYMSTAEVRMAKIQARIDKKDSGAHEDVGTCADTKKDNTQKKDSGAHEGVGTCADTKKDNTQKKDSGTHKGVEPRVDTKNKDKTKKKDSGTHEGVGPCADTKKDKNKKKDSRTHEGTEKNLKKNDNIKKKVQLDEGKLVGMDGPSEGVWKLLPEIEAETLWKLEDMNIGIATETGPEVVGQVFGVARKKLPIRSSRAKQTSNKETPIIVSSPTLTEAHSMLHLRFEISNMQVIVIEEGEGRLVATRGNVTRSRLASEADIDFVSMRSKVVVRIDDKLLREIFINEASTRTMNLFGMWMENKLPLAILEKVFVVDSMWYSMSSKLLDTFLNRFFMQMDVAGIQLCFFPIICRNHWSLFTLYVNKNLKVPRLKGRKSYLLYMDSLGLTESNECLDQMYIALKCLAPRVADSTLQDALFNPATKLELKIVEVPQQPNGTDCGFYVMAFMRYLIAGILQNSAGKTWLTK